MRVLVCGSRYWHKKKPIRRELKKFSKGTIVIHGANKRWDKECEIYTGADYLAGEVAKKLGLKVEEFPADWTRYGKGAGMRRNAQMLSEGKPDRILAFTKDLLDSKGTQNMVALGLENGIPTEVFAK